MKTSLEKIRLKIVGAPRFNVSAELNSKVLRSLGHAVEETSSELGEERILLPEGWLSDWLKRSFRQFSYVAIVLAVVIAGSWFLNQDTYSTHLNRARVALADLQSVLDGKPIATASLIPPAFAEEPTSAVSANDSQVVDLTQSVVHETESAIDLAGKGTDTIVIQNALSEVIAFQDQTIPVFASAVEAVKSDEAVQSVANALEKTTTDQSVVQKAHDFVAKAASNGEKQVAIDIQTASESKPALPSDPANDGKRLEEAKAAYEEAKAQIENVKTSGAGSAEVTDLQTKLEKVVSAFEEGAIGRAHGLSIAIAAQGKHFIWKGAGKGIQDQQGGQVKEPKLLDLPKNGKLDGGVKEPNGVQIDVEKPEAKTEVQPSNLKGFGNKDIKVGDAKAEKPDGPGAKEVKAPGQSEEKEEPSRLPLIKPDDSHPKIPKLENGARIQKWGEWDTK